MTQPNLALTPPMGWNSWNAPVSWESLGLPDLARCEVTELLSGEDRGGFTRFYSSQEIPTHGCEVIRVVPEDS